MNTLELIEGLCWSLIKVGGGLFVLAIVLLFGFVIFGGLFYSLFR